MAREENFEREPVPPAYGNGMTATYFPGSARKSDVPYSKSTKLVGLLILIGLLAVVVWATLGIAGLF